MIFCFKMSKSTKPKSNETPFSISTKIVFILLIKIVNLCQKKIHTIYTHLKNALRKDKLISQEFNSYNFLTKTFYLKFLNF